MPSPGRAGRRRIEADELLFITLFGLLTTAISYRIGIGNQVEHLPLVERLLDPTFLQNDFYVEAVQTFGPRYYYVHLLAAIAGVVSLPAAVAGLALLVNVALVGVTHFAARDLLGADKLAGFIAAILTVSVSGFALGLVADIRLDDLQPGSVAIPWALGALWAGLRGRAVLAAVLAAVASVTHPLYGLETGGVALATAGVVLFGSTGVEGRDWRRAALGIGAGLLVLLTAAWVLWGVPTLGVDAVAPSSDLLRATLVDFRAPHHYLPSVFPARHYLGCGLFLTATGWIWRQWSRSSGAAPILAAPVFFTPFIVVLAGCVVGGVAVELWPSRLWIIAQPFRLLYLIKWLGFLLIGWLLARWLREAERPRRWLGWVALVGSNAGVQAPVLWLALLIDRWTARLRPVMSAATAATLAGALALGLLVTLGVPHETLRVGLGLALAGALVWDARPVWRRAACIVLAGLILIATGANRTLGLVEWAALRPVLVYADHRGDAADLARWAGEHTPEEAIFLVPPDLGEFRLLARRALVVDFKAVPFGASALAEWRERIRACYGDVSGGGFVALEAMEDGYHDLSAETLGLARDRYGARFAVVYADTPIERQALYENATYRLVGL